MLHTFLLLAIPTVLEQLLGTVLQYVDTAMVGHLGADATAAISLSSTYNWFFNSLVAGIAMGFLSYIARAIGEKDEYKIRHAAAMALEMALAIGAALTLITQLIAPYVPVWMGAAENIRETGTWYFRLVFLPMIFRSCMVVLASVIRSTGDTKTPMRINVFINALNVVLNYLFIYLLGYGAIGAGIATALSFVVGGILMVISYLRNPYVKLERQYLPIEPAILKSILNIGIPSMMTSAVSCFGYIVATSLVSAMSTVVFAAHSIAITAEQIFYIPGYGMQAATSTLIGNALGEGDRRKEHSVMGIALGIVMILMLGAGLILFFGAHFMMTIFTTDAEVIRIGAGLLRIVALTEPIFGASIVLDGIYIGLGRTKIPMVIEIIGRWGIRIVGAYIMIRRFGGGINEYWYCMIADNIVRALLLGIGVLWIVRHEENHTSDRFGEGS